jgi:hypothetical protein
LNDSTQVADGLAVQDAGPFSLQDSAPVSPVLNLESARSLANDHNLSMAIAELDLSNRPAGDVNLARDDRRAGLSAPRRPAGAGIAAVSNLDSGRLRVEVRCEHPVGSVSRRYRNAKYYSSIGVRPSLELS